MAVSMASFDSVKDGLEGELMTPWVSMLAIAAGPKESSGEVPNSAYTKSPKVLAYKPYTGGSPATQPTAGVAGYECSTHGLL